MDTMIEGYDHRISWTAPEHVHIEHGADWFWAVGIISASLAVAFIIAGNILLSIIIIIGMGCLLYYAKSPAKIIECELSNNGVRSGTTLYPWESLDSFWILDGREAPKQNVGIKLLITSKKTLMPHIVIPLEEHVLQEVHQAMAHMLHEEHQTEPLPERLMRKIGL